jgi:plastocyanin
MVADRFRARWHVGAGALLVVAVMSACSKPAEPPSAAQPREVPPTTAPPAAAAAGFGRVAGRVAAAGTAVVVLEPKTARAFGPQDEKPVMDQVGLTFGPELLVVRTGQPVEFRNSDDTLHNVNVRHEETREQAFNVAIPTGASYEHTFPRDGFYRVGCDIHPAMSASIFSSSSPFATVADSDGSFAFSDVPTGAWTVKVYTGGRQLQKEIDVKNGVTDVTVE